MGSLSYIYGEGNDCINNLVSINLNIRLTFLNISYLILMASFRNKTGLFNYYFS